MKPSRKYSKPVLLGTLVISTLALVAWSPPTGEDIFVSSGTPAVAIGSANQIEGFTHTSTIPADTTAFRGFLAGKSNYVGSGNSNGFAAVIGNSNTANAYSSVIVGNSNVVANGATTGTASLAYSGIFGHGNVIPMNCDTLLVSGTANTVNGNGSFATGRDNPVEGVSGGLTYHSAAIGQLNHVAAPHGYAIGYANNVFGDRGVVIGPGSNAGALESVAIGSANDISSSSSYSYALGGGLRVTQPGSLALGSWNALMVAGDVMVVGCRNSTTPATALRVTSNGGVILSRAQGDISMGIYDAN